MKLRCIHAAAWLAFIGVLPCSAQVLPPERATDWSTAGFQLPIPEPTITTSIIEFGGVGDGVTPNDAALIDAFNAVQGQVGVIEFPPGNYLFNSTILMPDGVILRGATADSTTLTFSLGGVGHCIAAVGEEAPMMHQIIQPCPRGTFILPVVSSSGILPTDNIRMYRDDLDLVTSPWAAGTAGQIARVTILGGFVVIAVPLRADYPMARNPYFHVVHARRFVGIECLKIMRTDPTPPDEWSNIFFQYASHCWVKGVESDHCNFAHVELFASTNCEISGCYFHHAFAYGGGGQGYGVIAYYTSGENDIHDNIFEHLRHSMIVQAGANGNVFAYNRSVDPYWNEGLFPPNSAGEIVLHGDYAYLNLFESNIVQNAVIDDSHGKNGPYNTLFRNRIGLWGFLMNNAPATDSVNIIGNDVNGSPGLFVVNGNGNFLYGNDVQGTITPPGTDDLTDESYYAATIPDFLLSMGAWPQIGPNSAAPGSIPAAERYTAGTGLTLCEVPDIGTAVHARNEQNMRCYPSPFGDHFTVEVTGVNGPLNMTLQNMLGEVVIARSLIATGSPIDVNGCADLPAGLYLLRLEGAGLRASSRIVKDHVH